MQVEEFEEFYKFFPIQNVPHEFHFTLSKRWQVHLSYRESQSTY